PPRRSRCLGRAARPGAAEGRSGRPCARDRGRSRMIDEARAALETALGYFFRRSDHLHLALRHRPPLPGEPNNAKPASLRHAVLATALSEPLMSAFPQAREGELSKTRASLVNAEVLARRARELDLGRWLLLGKGEEKSGGREKGSILAAAYEALLGAIYLDA